MPAGWIDIYRRTWGWSSPASATVIVLVFANDPLSVSLSEIPNNYLTSRLMDTVVVGLEESQQSTLYSYSVDDININLEDSSTLGITTYVNTSESLILAIQENSLNTINVGTADNLDLALTDAKRSIIISDFYVYPFTQTSIVGSIGGVLSARGSIPVDSTLRGRKRR